ncbi:hypothetical protein BGZ70_003122 [Mortierella alpina]|uniref:Pre-rRNA-processing protein Ipi1 N-terminal domain-containing protein n=1 Tax=Mortierella alpina TaxID=64518 RepID=A0A9P6M5C4_MORAP|nr:hypothetical protein BGZ70_003122 [Mortierella alpina]
MPKSSTISLPSQSISHDKTAALTNSRNVTFAELMTQLKHYSPGTRKDALLGLRDLFHRHSHLLPLHLGVLVNSIVRLLIDDSSIVRKALQTFLGEFIPMLHARDIHPFLPLLIVYTCSAMTHILEDIREDALKFMDLWIAAGGQIVVNGFWDKIVPNYVSLLTSDSNATNASKLSSAMSFSASAGSGMVGGSGTAAVTSKTVAGASTGKNAPGSMKAKSDVLQSLAGFLQEGLGGEGGDKDPYWFLRNFLGTAHARKSFNTARTQLGAHEGVIKGSKKRKVSNAKTSNGSAGRAVRRKADTSDESDDESSEDESGSSEDEDEKHNTGEGHYDPEESYALDPAPVVSFNKASALQQLLSTFPLHPSATQSSMTQVIWGELKSADNDPTAPTNIPIKIFPQQGGASASGAGANAGVSGSGVKGGDNLGGVQGRLAQIKPLISTLHPLLLSIWLDTAPTVFASTTAIHANHALTIVHLVLKIWGILWRAALARPKTKSADTDEERDREREEEKWLDEYLQSLLRHVLIYFPFGKDTVGVTDSKVAALLEDMNTTYCELTSLFLLGSGVGRIRRVHKDSLQKSHRTQEASNASSKSKKPTVKSSYRPSNKSAKKKNVVVESYSSSSDYDSEEDEEDQREKEARKKSNMVTVQVETPAWADQVVDFVLDTLGWDRPDKEDEEDETVSASLMTSLSTDFKSQHLVALLPTLWTLLNCLETSRRECVFEALMAFFDNAHDQSGSKRTVLQFLALVVKLQSHPHYTGSFTIMVPGAHAGSVNKTLMGLSKRDRKEQQSSIAKISKLFSSSLLKLPKLLWDLDTESIETSQTTLDLLAWVAIIAGESRAQAANDAERVQFLKTLQSYMALFFCVTVAAKGEEGGKRTVMGPFVRLPPALQRRAIEIVFYTGVVESDLTYGLGSGPQRKKDKADQKQVPLLAAVKSCCQASDLSEETRLYIQETLRIA